MQKNIYYRFSLYKDLFIGALKPDTYRCVGNCDVLLCCHDVDRGDTYEGKAYSKLIDSLQYVLCEKGWSCIQFSYPPSSYVGVRAYGEPVSANRRFLLLKLIGRFKRILNSLQFLNGIISSKSFSLMEALFEELLITIEPKVVVAIGSPPELCRVAKTKSIPVFELLHGIGYAYIPWGWDQEEAINLPDGVLSLDIVSTNTFSLLQSKGIEVKQIPHPFYRRFMCEKEFNKLPVEWKIRPKWIPTDKIIILYSIQWGYDGDHGEYKEYKGILKNGIIHEELMKTIEETQSEVYWLLRLHPVQLILPRYKYQKLLLDDIVKRFSNCDWKRSSELPLPLLLKYVNGHISMASMTAYDAALMGIRSLMLCPTLKANGMNSLIMADLRDSEFVQLGDFSAKNIKDWVLNVRKADMTYQNFNEEKKMDEAIEWMLGRIYKLKSWE
jgi:hypothetical protein